MSSLNKTLDKSLESKFNDLKVAINKDKGRWPSAQGVNALIMVYPPDKEDECLSRVKKDYGHEYIINISELFVDYIDKFGLDTFTEVYKNYRSTSVFVDDSSSEEDLLDIILDEIEKAHDKGKKPVLIRTGILYGTGIRNNDILESDLVTKSKEPLLVFYPGEVREDVSGEERVYFLGVLKASDYRGILI